MENGRGKDWPTLREDSIWELAERITLRLGDQAKISVLGSKIQRKEISRIQFESELKNAPDGAWDVSQKKDSRVWAWVISGENGLYSLHIAGDGGVNLPENCSCLFAGYRHVTAIDFGHCVSTAHVTNMAHMFAECKSLKTLDVTHFDTRRVENMADMFSGCVSLTVIRASTQFVIPEGEEEIFDNCPAGGVTLQ